VRKYPFKAKERIEALIKTLKTLHDRDPEQEVQGIALPVLDALIEGTRGFLSDDPVVAAVAGIISPQTIAEGEPIRAADALLVAEQLSAALGRRPNVIA
jgi:hypothetical protein